MKILALADEEEKIFWDLWDPKRLHDVDLIISCGDLDPAYLEFLVTMTNLPLLYVRGNHDTGYHKRPPEGCICIEDRIFTFRGCRFLGLGGSMRYKEGSDQYTERQMSQRVLRLMPQILRCGGFDVLVAHAPARGYGDLDDLPHTGFRCFNRLMERHHPVCMIHGHIHMRYGRIDRMRTTPEGTHIINVCGHQFLEIPDRNSTISKLRFGRRMN